MLSHLFLVHFRDLSATAWIDLRDDEDNMLRTEGHQNGGSFFSEGAAVYTNSARKTTTVFSCHFHRTLMPFKLEADW